jgi:ABC-type multidrug transport system ATPase subunit
VTPSSRALESLPRATGPGAPAEPVIEAVELHKQFRTAAGTLDAVAGVDLAVGRGEFFGLLGPNGAGKSTTIGMLTTRVVPTRGAARVAGVDVVRAPALAKRVLGVVPQTNTLDRQLTVAQNLEFHGRFFGLGRRESRRRADEMLERFSLSGRAGDDVAGLSGGMAQRLMVARALLHRPAVLFLDEPTSGIDPQTRLKLWALLRELHAEGQTILLTTHYMEEADALCERLAVIDGGRVLAEGSPRELKKALRADTVTTVTYDGPADAVAEEVRRVPGVTRVDVDGPTLTVRASGVDGLLSRLVDGARRVGLEVSDASHQPPSLTDVFLDLTGRDYRE